MTYVDATGRTLEDYPRPSLAVDTAVLTVTDDGLAVLLVRDPADPGSPWRLPGTFLHPGERLADAVARALQGKAGLGERTLARPPAQLHVFDAPDRDDRGWVVSVAHLATAPAAALAALDPGRARLVPVDDAHGLPFDHDEIVRFAVDELRRRYATQADPERLLAAPFTVKELRTLHEAVAGRDLPRDTFRRRVLPELRATGRMQQGQVGKPAELYRHGRPRA